MTFFRLALRNILGRPARSASVAAGIAVVSGTLFVVTLVYVSISASLERGSMRLGADAMVVPGGWAGKADWVLLSGGPTEAYMDGSVVEALRGMDFVETASGQLFIKSARLACCSVSDTMLVGFDPGGDFTISPWLREALERPLGDDEVVVGANILSEPGGRIRFYAREFRIAGKLEPVGLEGMDSAVFIPIGGARAMIEGSAQAAEKALDVRPDEISAVLVRFKRDVGAGEAAIRIEHALHGARVVLASEMLVAARGGLLLPLRAVIAAGALQWAVSLFMVGVLFGLSVQERTREIGLMRAMGARPGDMLKAHLLEALVVSFAGGVAGASSGALFLFFFKGLLRASLDVPFLFPGPLQASGIFVLTVLFALFSGLGVSVYPVLRASALPASEAAGERRNPGL